MLLVSYDISNDKVRTRFSKFLSKFGFRLQYSVYEIRNSERVLQNIIAEIKNSYEHLFEETDSIIIFNLKDSCEKIPFGNARNNDSDFIILT